MARPRQQRRVELDVERVRTAIDGEPGQPKRAAGHALRSNVERAMGQRDGVSAGAPVAPDRERHDVVAGDEIDIDETLDLVTDQRNRWVRYRVTEERPGRAVARRGLGAKKLNVFRLISDDDSRKGAWRR